MGNTVNSLQDAQFQWYTIFVIAGQFILLGIISVAMGVIFGFSGALIFKHLRFLNESAVTEMFVMFAWSMGAYDHHCIQNLRSPRYILHSETLLQKENNCFQRI